MGGKQSLLNDEDLDDYRVDLNGIVKSKNLVFFIWIDINIFNSSKNFKVRNKSLLFEFDQLYNSNIWLCRVVKRFCQLVPINQQHENISQWRLSKKQAININELYVT